MVSIDASKAFDKVNRTILWTKLLKKVGFQLTNMIKRYYMVSEASVTNCGLMSRKFKTTIGVKQGGPLSPRLFALYIEDLLIQLVDSNLGVKIGNLLVPVIAYADDIILLSSNKEDMQKLLNITSQFGEENELKFNESKTNYMLFTAPGLRETKTEEQLLLKLNNMPLNKVSTSKYLGYCLD